MLKVLSSSLLTLAVASQALGPMRHEKGSNAIFDASAADVLHIAPGPGPNGLARTPPMGWMSWQVFHCDTNCKSHPTSCIDHNLYEQMATQIVEDGYLKVGYNQVSIDDCWENQSGRDKNGHLIPDPSRFPSGMKALGDYMHSKGVQFGIYSDEGTETCGGFPGTKGYEKDDADTFASWGVDYLKMDGCHNDKAGYATGYPAAGAALQASGRNITYSCSWPAYLGSDEAAKPFADMIQAGCNLWRNFKDVQCNWGAVTSIIDHWGDYGKALQPWAGPGHWHDMDMLLIGANCITNDEERTQMAIWSISASPLIMGNDLRNISAESKQILLNKDAIAVSQDVLGKMGTRHEGYTSASPTQLWSRDLIDGDVAVVLYNSHANPPIPGAPCNAWNHTEDGYLEACGSDAGGGMWKCDAAWRFSNLTVQQAQDACCKNKKCAGFSFNAGSGCYKGNQDCGKVGKRGFDGYTKPSQMPQQAGKSDITLMLSDVGFSGKVTVYDIWEQKSLGMFEKSYTATSVPLHGNAFLRISDASSVLV